MTVSNGNHGSNGANYRISDAEREAAMASLGRAFSEGRLTIDEYDERVQQVACAQTGTELLPLFDDLPASRRGGLPGQAPAKLYAGEEIDAAYQHGKKTRLGLLGLTTVGSAAGTILLSAMVASPLPAVLLLLIPTVWLMLYVMKIGPDSWHVPSPQSVERQRLRELRSSEKLRAAERKAAEQERAARQKILEEERLMEVRLARKAQTEELTGRAIGLVNKAFDPETMSHLGEMGKTGLKGTAGLFNRGETGRHAKGNGGAGNGGAAGGGATDRGTGNGGATDGDSSNGGSAGGGAGNGGATGSAGSGGTAGRSSDNPYGRD
ncbi:DUF1707 domain-containing protein [Corynebacterium sp. NPDC060344]|uniref:DUF1707 SHOCT-like domain-containing protein n=1 Tax=Corynebacterium sp. NPDC060344 TaxID=3347101 RepID=UPI0036671D19